MMLKIDKMRKDGEVCFDLIGELDMYTGEL